VKVASSEQKGKRHRAPKPSTAERPRERLDELTTEIRRISALVQKTYDLLQRVEDRQVLRPISLPETDPEDVEEMARYEAQTLVRARRRLAAEMKALRALGIIDEGGRLVPHEPPADMREESTCGV